jgi:hypothetical protein
MTVGDLLEQLESLPREADIYVADNSGGPLLREVTARLIGGNVIVGDFENDTPLPGEAFD